MENQIQKTSTKALSLESNKLAVSLFHYNQLTAFPISDGQIVDWVKSIQEIAPKLDAVVLKKIMDGFKVGLYEFNPKVGIQNVFNAYKCILKDEMSSFNEQINKGYGYNSTDDDVVLAKKAQEKQNILKQEYDKIFLLK